MAERSRHGLHVVRDGDAPAPGPTAPVLLPPGGVATLRLDLLCVELAVGGRLSADTSGGLRMLLSLFTVVGGPPELVLDLSGVYALDEDGMAPVFEADELMRVRQGSLRLTAISAAVAHFLEDGRRDRTLNTGPDDDFTRLGQD